MFDRNVTVDLPPSRLSPPQSFFYTVFCRSLSSREGTFTGDPSRGETELYPEQPSRDRDLSLGFL